MLGLGLGPKLGQRPELGPEPVLRVTPKPAATSGQVDYLFIGSGDFDHREVNWIKSVFVCLRLCV